MSVSRLRARLLFVVGAAGCSSRPASPPPPTSVTLGAEPSATASLPPAPTASSRPSWSALGWVTEADGSVHRSARALCDPAIAQESCRGDEPFASCKADSDCKEHPFGKCVSGQGQRGRYCGCEYACAQDDDCGSGEVCVCGDAAPNVPRHHAQCARAACAVDADCASRTCGLSLYDNGCGTTVSLACRSPDDACRSDSDCVGKPGVGRGVGTCAVSLRDDQPARWSCLGMTCIIGRPLVVEAQWRTARRCARHDWSV